MNKLLMFSLNSAVILMLLILPAIQQPPAMQVVTSGLNVVQDSGETIVVTSAADSGPGTLRQMLLDAQNGDTITFDPVVFPPTAPVTISVTSELPHIHQGNLTIDASNVGVILDGDGIPDDWAAGLQINSNGNVVWGLQIINFPGPGIILPSAAQGNTIGGDRSAGVGPLGQGNLISAIRGVGVYLSDASSNVVRGNYIGTDPNGAAVWGNRYDAILIDGGSNHNQLIDNLISGNQLSGIEIREYATDNIVGPNNVITLNDENGLQIVGPYALRNTITQNSIHDNGEGGGIELQNGGNVELAAPLIIEFDLGGGTVGGTACSDCTVEIFSDSNIEGEVYEGQATVDAFGFFTVNKGTPLIGPHLTATATDADGNTSRFSTPTSGTLKSTALQAGNNLPRTRLQSRPSGELEDNRIGPMFWGLWHPEMIGQVFPSGVLDVSHILEQGFKRARFAINSLDSDKVDWGKPEFSIDLSHDHFITKLADNGVTITYPLSFWDKAYKASGGEIPIPRFKTEEEIQRYLDYVRFIVRHFKDRIKYYEIWNEPSIKDIIQWIEVEDYINLVDRAVPVIRQEYPEAKIVVGGTHSLIDPDSQIYLFNILRSDIMPLVDVVAWHPMYGSSPEYDFHRRYYYQYPALVQEIKEVASAHGFTGEYVADEIHWSTADHPEPDWPMYSETKSVKYLTRSIIRHLATDVTVTQVLVTTKPLLVHTNQYLCTVLEAAEPASLPIKIQSTITNTVSYTFSLPNENYLIALWNDDVAVDDDPGAPATLTIPGFEGYEVTGIDVLHGFRQQLLTSEEDGDLIIRDLLVKDYPMILRLAPTRYIYLPAIFRGSDR